MRRIVIQAGALVATLLLLASAFPALANPDEIGECLEPGPCRVECREAQGICHLVADAAREACVEACSDDGGPCLRECARAHARARRICAEERAECRLACQPDVDPGCAQECLLEARDCRGERAACVTSCRARARAGFAECRERFGGDDGSPADLARCLKTVTRLRADCTADCRNELPCASELRECLGSCRLE